MFTTTLSIISPLSVNNAKMPSSVPQLLFVLGSIGSIGLLTTAVASYTRNAQAREEQRERKQSEAEFNEKYNEWIQAHRARYHGY